MGTKPEMTDILYAAADVGGMSTKLGLFSGGLELLQKWEIPTDISDEGRNILPKLCRSLRERAGDRRLCGIGIDVPCAVDRRHIAITGVNIGWKQPVDLVGEIGRLMPEVPLIRCGNDASVAALGELRMGNGRGYESVYLVTLGTGIGGGFAVNGRLIAGAHGAAGEAGHMTVNQWETTPCGCGRYGCLEQYASAAGMVRLAHNLLELKAGVRTEASVHAERFLEGHVPDCSSALEQMETFSAKDICDLARGGDEFCRYVVGVYADCLGLGMSIIACILDPEVFLIGGGLSRAGDLLFEPLRRSLDAHLYPACRGVRILPAGLGNDAGLYGCAAMLADVADSP